MGRGLTQSSETMRAGGERFLGHAPRGGDSEHAIMPARLNQFEKFSIWPS